MRNSFLIQYAIDFLIVKSLICITYKISDLFSFAFITLCFYEFFLLHLGISCYLSFCNICRLDIKASSSLLTIKIECKTNNHIYTNTHTHEKKEDKRERERERKVDNIYNRTNSQIHSIAFVHSTSKVVHRLSILYKDDNTEILSMVSSSVSFNYRLVVLCFCLPILFYFCY